MDNEKIYTIIKIKELEEQRDELNKQLFTVKHKDEFLGNRLKLRLLELQRIGNDISLSNKLINRLYKEIHSLQSTLNESYVSAKSAISDSVQSDVLIALELLKGEENVSSKKSSCYIQSKLENLKHQLIIQENKVTVLHENKVYNQMSYEFEQQDSLICKTKIKDLMHQLSKINFETAVFKNALSMHEKINDKNEELESMKLVVNELQQNLVESKKEKYIENTRRENYNSLKNEFNKEQLENIGRQIDSLKEKMERKDMELQNIKTENNSFKEELKKKDITHENIRKENNFLKKELKTIKNENRKRRIMLRETEKTLEYEIEKGKNSNKKNNENEKILKHEDNLLLKNNKTVRIRQLQNEKGNALKQIEDIEKLIVQESSGMVTAGRLENLQKKISCCRLKISTSDEEMSILSLENDTKQL